MVSLGEHWRSTLLVTLIGLSLGWFVAVESGPNRPQLVPAATLVPDRVTPIRAQVVNAKAELNAPKETAEEAAERRRRLVRALILQGVAGHNFGTFN